MASSSTSVAPKSYQFDVFLSFRGEDTRLKFVGHLYEALKQHGIQTFKDDKRIEKGKRINDELLESINDSKFCIIVFSENYASSSWCLDELVRIMESHKDTAYPVFYDVDPSQVRKQSGPVEKAFARHADNQAAGKWREALTEAGNLSGWDLRKTADGHEATVIKLIVEWISLNLRSMNVDIVENFVGMEQRMKDLDSCLEIGSNDVRMIGIKGMGGAGKTTLARAIFDKLSIQFDAVSFVENVREVSQNSPSGLRSLQEKVLSALLKEIGISVESVYDGKRMMRMRLRSKKILLVLDDVDHIEQLEALAGRTDWFKVGSRIIITTRDEQVLIAHKVKWIHDVTLLTNEEAICLFSRHAFGAEIPKSEFETRSLEAVRYAAGLPLTVRVLGSFLCGKNMVEWTDALKRLRTIPLKETLEKLELSFESLEKDYKEIFLDVTCFMRGWLIDDAIRMLESCGYNARIGLRVLEQRSLTTKKRGGSYGQIIDMHDHIEELGKYIVRRLHPDDPDKHSRLWIQEEIECVLANDIGTEATRCVYLKHSPNIVLQGLGNLRKLQCLHVVSEYYNPDAVALVEVCQYLPNSLRYLSWRGFPYCCLPNTLVLKKLTCPELRLSMIRTHDLGLTPNLETLDLFYCQNLEELHLPIGCLKGLTYVSLYKCWRLKSLSFIKQLESLEFLDLGCLSLSEFPDIIPLHSNSRLLWLHFDSNNIQELPSSIGNLHKLVCLNLTNCKNLKSLPPSLCSLQHLQHLDLSGCGIEELPENLGQLKSLVKLYLSHCNFKDIPSSIGMLKHLIKLRISECKHLEKLPAEIGDLECLEYLTISDTKVTHIPDSILMLKHLKRLRLQWLDIDQLPEDVGQLESLEVLDLTGCSIRKIPHSIGMLKHLRELHIYNCYRLKGLPDEVGELECLKDLDIRGAGISSLPVSISLLQGLRIHDMP